jgi:hypothetical protein
MNFDELIRLKALELKQLNTEGGSLGDAILEGLLKDPANSSQMRNICAHISPELFSQVEEYCGLLSLSKRKFVEMALVEAIDRAKSIVAEVDPFPAEA